MRSLALNPLMIAACFRVAASSSELLISALSATDLPMDSHKVDWMTLAWPALLKEGVAGVVIAMGWCCQRVNAVERPCVQFGTVSQSGRTIMLIEITKRSGELAEGVRQSLEQRMQLELGRFSQRIRRVLVAFSDAAGNSDCRDKKCRLRIELIPSGEVVVEGSAPSVATAFAKVAERSGRTVGRALLRRPEFCVVPERVIFSEPRRCRIDD